MCENKWNSMETHTRTHTHTRSRLGCAKLGLTRPGDHRLNANRGSCCSGPFWDKITRWCDRKGSELTHPHLSCSPFSCRGQRGAEIKRIRGGGWLRKQPREGEAREEQRCQNREQVGKTEKKPETGSSLKQLLPLSVSDKGNLSALVLWSSKVIIASQ